MKQDAFARVMAATLPKAEAANANLVEESSGVRRHDGRAIMVPSGMKLQDAALVLYELDKKEQSRLQQVTKLVLDLPCLPADGALLLHTVVSEVLGREAIATETPGFMGMKIAPTTILIKTSKGNVEVPWGRYVLEGGAVNLDCGITTDTNTARFRLGGSYTKGNAALVERITTVMGDLLKKTPSLYTGTALRATLTAYIDGELQTLQIPEITPFDTALTHGGVYNEDTSLAIEAGLLAPIRHRAKLTEAGISFRRGVLLCGTYGVGKSLLARMVADTCVKHGVTFLYITEANDIALATRLASMLQPAVLFVEDIDRVTVAGLRNVSTDEVLNALDGVDTKGDAIMTVLTTNNLGGINEAMLRPGRAANVVIDIGLPTLETTSKLFLLYGGALLQDAASREAAELLVRGGATPAVIREVVERAKLISLARNPGQATVTVTGVDVRASAAMLVAQLKLLELQPRKLLGFPLSELVVKLPAPEVGFEMTE